MKTDGIDFAIIRAGYGRLASQKDKLFEQNYSGAKAVGIPVGACETPHLYEDEIKKRFIEVCNRIASDKEEFLISCQQIVEMLSNTAALDKKIEAQYIYLNGLAVSMQEFIKENAMKESCLHSHRY